MQHKYIYYISVKVFLCVYNLLKAGTNQSGKIQDISWEVKIQWDPLILTKYWYWSQFLGNPDQLP